jgi:hypothetical protein
MSASTTADGAAAAGRGRAGIAGGFVLALVASAVSVAPCRAAAILAAQDQPAPAPALAPSEDQPKTNPDTPKNVEQLAPDDAAAVLGKKVKGPKGEDLGLIVDVLVDADGRPRAAVIDFGGFLGVGSRKIAIDWKALGFTPLGRSGSVELGLDRAQIAAAPEYRPGQPGIAVVTAPPAPPPPADVHQ